MASKIEKGKPLGCAERLFAVVVGTLRRIVTHYVGDMGTATRRPDTWLKTFNQLDRQFIIPLIV